MKNIALFALFFLVLQAFILWLLGQPPICTCGYIKFWEGVVLSSGNSQHITDWYTFSHIIHGFIFYFLSWLIFPRASIGMRFIFALGIEVSWEIIENTPMVIEHYRQQALASGYNGDSIINTISDSLSMILGFWMAGTLPVWFIILIGFCLEIWVGYEIRDNLTLNIINLLYVFPAIKAWQAGA